MQHLVWNEFHTTFLHNLSGTCVSRFVAIPGDKSPGYYRKSLRDKSFSKALDKVSAMGLKPTGIACYAHKSAGIAR